MHNKLNVFARPDTLFGVCEALGEDLRFNPLFLRLAFAVPLIWYPKAVLAVYAAAAVIVVISRLLFPNPRPVVVSEPAVAEAVAAERTVEEKTNTRAPELAIAA